MKTKKSQLEDITNLMIERLESTDDIEEITNIAKVMKQRCNNPECSFCQDLEAFINSPDVE